MNDNPRNEILKKIRTGLEKHFEDKTIERESGSPNLNSFLSEPGELAADKMAAIFSEELSKVDGMYHILEDHDELEYRLLEIIYSYRIESYCLSKHEVQNELDIEDMLESRGLKKFRSADKDEISRADMGITGADYGIADTGTIVVLSDDDNSRSVSLLPPVHIAFLKMDTIVQNIHQLFYKFKNSNPGITENSSCITFITGPSRTADIELNLTLGVHGPGKLIVFILK